MSRESQIESQIESMTGYGESRAKLGGVTLVCRMRSLNHRFLDVKLRLPRNDMLSLDIGIRKSLSESFKRGAVEVTVATEMSRDAATPSVNAKLAKGYWSEMKKLAKALGSSKTGPTLDALLRLPGVVGTASADDALVNLEDEEVLEKLVLPAVKALRESRKKEGKLLAEHILKMIAQMESHVAEIAKLEGPEKERARDVIVERAQATLELLKSISSSEPTEEFRERLREEAVFWVEKRDFEEERMRLSMHLKTFRELLNDSKEVSGRRLEFLQQEILREINTLGTKAQSPAITSHTIELKTTLERIREQLANVE